MAVSGLSVSAVVFFVMAVLPAVIVMFLFVMPAVLGPLISFHIHPAIVLDIVGTARVDLDDNARRRRQEAVDIDIYIGRHGRVEA